MFKPICISFSVSWCSLSPAHFKYWCIGLPPPPWFWQLLNISKIAHFLWYKFSSVQSLSHVWLFATPWTAAHQASLSITNSWKLLKLMSFESVMPSNHLIPVVPFSSCLQSFLASGSFPVSQFFTSGGQSIGVSQVTCIFFLTLLLFFFCYTQASSSCGEQRVLSSCNAWASPWCVFSCCGAQALEHSDFSSCSTWAQ